MKYIQLVIISLLVILIFFQYKIVNTHSNSYDILQVNNPQKDKFEEILSKKCITVFTNIIKDLDVINDISYNDLKNMNDKNKSKLEILLNNHFKYYIIPMCIKYDFYLNLENNGFQSNINKVTSYRFLYSQIFGTKRLILFNTLQSKYLYIKNNKSLVDFWNQDLKKFPLLSKSKYIELVLSPGQMIYIPYGWFYCYKNTSDNIYITCKSESLFSYLLK
jgi:hypothetical protein